MWWIVMTFVSSLPTEAAFTLLLYWELLHWEDRPLREFLHYPTQSEWQRKEGLSRKVLHYFNKGKASQAKTSQAKLSQAKLSQAKKSQTKTSKNK